MDWTRPQPDSRFVELDGLRLHYKDAGAGPAVLLLHGSGSSLQGFDAVASLLSRSFRIVRPDLPGSGLTGPRADRDYRIETFTAMIGRFMDRIGVPKYAAAGNSLGGNIAWNLALDRPAAVDALVLVNATGYPTKSRPAGLRLARNPVLRPLLRRWLPRAATAANLRGIVGANAAVVDAAMIDGVHGLMARAGNRSALVDLANTDQTDRTRELGRIVAPTLVLRSAGIDGQDFARDIAGSREQVHPDGGHLLPEEDPDWVAAAIARFLASLPAPSSTGGHR